MPTASYDLPDGVAIRSLNLHRDDRGAFLEIFRNEWGTGCEPIQWNVVQSEANVLRGVHVHITHADYLVVIAGRMQLGLHDIRPGAPKNAASRMITLDATQPVAVTIPAGVCHGFYFPIPSIHVYAVSHYWNTSDELGCRFNAPELGLSWPTTAPRLSDRDATASEYRQMVDQYLTGRQAFAATGDNEPGLERA